MNEIQDFFYFFFISTSSLKNMYLSANSTFIFQLLIVCNKGMIFFKTHDHKCKRIHQYSHFTKFLKTQKINLQDSVPFNAVNSVGGQNVGRSEWVLAWLCLIWYLTGIITVKFCLLHALINNTVEPTQTDLYVVSLRIYVCARLLCLFHHPGEGQKKKECWVCFDGPRESASCWGRQTHSGQLAN